MENRPFTVRAYACPWEGAPHFGAGRAGPDCGGGMADAAVSFPKTSPALSKPSRPSAHFLVLKHRNDSGSKREEREAICACLFFLPVPILDAFVQLPAPLNTQRSQSQSQRLIFQNVKLEKKKCCHLAHINFKASSESSKPRTIFNSLTYIHSTLAA